MTFDQKITETINIILNILKNTPFSEWKEDTEFGGAWFEHLSGLKIARFDFFSIKWGDVALENLLSPDEFKEIRYYANWKINCIRSQRELSNIDLFIDSFYAYRNES